MTVWNPPRETVRIRNGKVVSASAGVCTVTLDGTQNVDGVPVYGSVSPGQGVLVLEQGGSLLVVGLNDRIGSYIVVGGFGIAYAGATYPGGGSNLIGFRWAAPNILAGVDNVVSAVVGTVATGRLKRNVRAVAGGLETVLRLRPVMYNALELDGTSSADTDDHIGLVAEEVAEVVPSAVITDADGAVASVNYHEIVPLLVAAVQELAAGVAAMEARLRDG